MTVPSTYPEADVASLRGLLEGLPKRSCGPIAVSAAPIWKSEPVFEFKGVTVTVRTAPSVLAIRDALTARRSDEWLVILTDQDSSELPLGVTEHLVNHRIHNLDPWPSLRRLFRAERQEYALLTSRLAARAALRQLDGIDIAPAPDGVLTRKQLFGTLAAAHFGWAGAEFTPHAIALWSARPEAARFVDWRQSTEMELAEEFFDWLTDEMGTLGKVFALVLRHREPMDLVPLGLVAGLMSDTMQATEFPAGGEEIIALRTRLEALLGGDVINERLLRDWANISVLALPVDATTPLERAERYADQLRATALLGRSDVLQSGLAARIDLFASKLGAVLPGSEIHESVRDAWELVSNHREAHVDDPAAQPAVLVATTALRLLRWLRHPQPTEATAKGWVTRYRTELAWVDTALSGVQTATGHAVLDAAVRGITDAAAMRRETLERSAAVALTALVRDRSQESDAPLYIEDVLDRVIAPLTTAGRTDALGAASKAGVRVNPILLLALDGVDTCAVNQALGEIRRRQGGTWQEYLAIDDVAQAALSVSPDCAGTARSSLLSARLTAGTADSDVRAFSDWLRTANMTAVDCRQPLFHPNELDPAAAKDAVATAVREAIQDTVRRPVVACVLDLDGRGATTERSIAARLMPMLAVAATVGRTVVIVGCPAQESANVALADLVAPILILALEHDGEYRGLQPAPLSMPRWWNLAGVPAVQPTAPPAASEVRFQPTQQDLFTDTDTASTPKTGDPIRQVLATSLFGQQYRRYGRGIRKESIAALLNALLPAGLLGYQEAANILGTGLGRTRQQIMVISQVLNVDGIIVFGDQDGEVVLNASLLYEQYGVTP